MSTSTLTTPPTAESASPADVVGAVYSAFERRDIEGALALFSRDIRISQSEALPWGGTYEGHAGALQFFGTLTSAIETQVDVERFIVAGDTVVEVGRTCGRALISGTEFAIDEVHVWTVRDGRVAEMRAYVDDAAMLTALAS
jgi:ketosteroid isomerase-like protein